MKKFLFLFILFANILMAQSTFFIAIKDTANGFDSTGLGKVYLVGNDSLAGFKALPVEIHGGTSYLLLTQAQIDSLQLVHPRDGYFNTRDSWNWTRYWISFEDSAIATVDTIQSGSCTDWWRVTITTDDTINISSDASFTYPARTQSAVRLFPGETYTTDKLNITYTPKIYFRRYGTAGTPRIRVFWEGF